MNVLALCAGIGGLELGLKIVEPNARTVCFVEGEAYAASVLVSQMEKGALDSAPIWSDVRTFDGSKWRGLVDIVTVGYPCQPFSSSGSRKGSDDPRHLWPHIRRIIQQCEPQWVFLENVEGHLSLGFQVVGRELSEDGFHVEAGLFSASELGNTHKRKRLFALAHTDEARLQGREKGLGEESREADNVERPGSAQVAYADSNILKSIHESSCSEQSRREIENASGWYGYPAFFPPGPEEDWEGVHETFWPAVSVERDISGVADGLSYRVDRVHCLGNAVVPMVAAHAYHTLRKRIGI